MRLKSLIAGVLSLSLAGSLITIGRSGSDAATVIVEKTDSGFRLVRNGTPYPIHGVGGKESFAELVALGGNSIRTWGVEGLGDVLDTAHKHGLTVCAGLWMGHQRHGFDYQNQSAVLDQLDRLLKAVEQHKDHPALLLWGVGNEMEGDGFDPSVWYAVNHLAREIKRIDGKHPTMTVIAELGADASKVKSIERFCPDIDIIGINSYGGIESIGRRYRKAGGTKPYVITEHGTHGPWEVGKTKWGSPIEPSSTSKGQLYARGYRANVLENADLCLGTYAFLWGHKQETTATWFGMLLPDGSRLEAVDAMAHAWSGKPVPNRCPQIESLTLTPSGKRSPRDRLTATLRAKDPERDPLRFRWELRADSGTIGEGGDPQEAEAAVRDAVKASGPRATVTVPKTKGAYRLFVYVYDNTGGAAVANVPFYSNGK